MHACLLSAIHVQSWHAPTSNLNGIMNCSRIDLCLVCLRYMYCKLSDVPYRLGVARPSRKGHCRAKPNKCTPSSNKRGCTSVKGYELCRPTVCSIMHQMLKLVAISHTDGPDAAHAAFTHGFTSKWTNLTRIVPNVSDSFSPLEAIISNRSKFTKGQRM